MNKILALFLIGFFLVACSKVDLGEKKAFAKILEPKSNETSEKKSAISTISNYTQEKVSDIAGRIKIDERYETPSVIVDRVDDEIEVENFGEVI